MLRDIVINLLHNLGARAEVNRWLAEYEDSRTCTVVAADGALVQSDLDGLSAALALLHHLGLRPVVVQDAGPQLQPDAPDIAVRKMRRASLALADAMKPHGVQSSCTHSAMLRVPRTSPEQGLDAITDHADDEINRATERGQMPILAPLGLDADGQTLNLCAERAALALAGHRRSRKTILLGVAGGLTSLQGRIIPAVNCTLDLDAMLRDGLFDEDTTGRLLRMRQLLAGLDLGASVSITSPSHLARELFTHRGSGTLVRMGTPIRSMRGMAELDCARTARLLERGFGKRLDANFFSTLDDASIYVGGDYSAVAIVRPGGTGTGADCLDKLALGPEARGIGLGASIWCHLRQRHARLYWRARPDNPANKWYLPRADGMHRTADWLVFWCGLEGRAQIESCIGDALARPATMVDCDD